MKKKWWIVISVILVIALAAFFTAGYFLGNVPIASKLLGTNKPRNLGVTVSVDGAYQGLKDLKKPLTPDEISAVIQNPNSYSTIKATITQDEASSLVSLGDIPNSPFKLTQIKFGANGQVQASGVLDITALQAALKDVGATGDVVDQVMGFVKNAKYLNYYLEGNCSITNNRITAQIDELEIGRISLPTNMVKDNSSAIADSVARTLTSAGYNIRKMDISEGKVTFDMDRPVSSINPWLKFVQYK